MLDSPTSVFFLPHKEVESTSYWKLHSEFVFRGVVGLSQHCSCRINAYEAEPIAQNQLSSNVWFHQNISDFLLVHSSYSFAKSINAIGLRTRTKFCVLLVNDSQFICTGTPNMPITNTNKNGFDLHFLHVGSKLYWHQSLKFSIRYHQYFLKNDIKSVFFGAPCILNFTRGKNWYADHRMSRGCLLNENTIYDSCLHKTHVVTRL